MGEVSFLNRLESLLLKDKWDQPLWFVVLMIPFAWIMRMVTGLRRLSYEKGLLTKEKLPGKVISIGNIIVGGTGKSPMVHLLARAIVEKGGKPAVLMRGYRSGMKSNEWVGLLDGDVRFGSQKLIDYTGGDEARMHTRDLPGIPIVVGRHRYQAARNFLAESGFEITHWILDDGLQHLKIARDVDVVLIDAKRPFGNQRILPLGYLREVPHAMRQAKVVVFTRVHDGYPMPVNREKIRHYAPKALVLMSRTKMGMPKCTKDQIEWSPKFAPTLAICGIARPGHFLDGLKEMGINCGGRLTLSDHEPINVREVIKSLGTMRSIVTTAKDYWRDPDVFNQLPVPVFVIPLALVWDGEDGKRFIDAVF